MQDKIIIKGAREHNLKNIDLELPKNKLIVFTGVSGSGKSSLAFDTIFAEGQRRFIESLSSYARQFLGQKDKPDVESIEGLSPAIAIDQKAGGHNPRSTVATITEIYDYLRVLFARVGTPYCPNCQIKIEQMSVDEIVSLLENKLNQKKGGQDQTPLTILAPVVEGRKGEYHQLLYDLYLEGFEYTYINGKKYRLSQKIDLSRYKKHKIEVVIDEFTSLLDVNRTRLTEAVELALQKGNQVITVRFPNKEKQTISSKFTCPNCRESFTEIEPRLFSFNSPYGACGACDGLGSNLEIDENLVIIDSAKSLKEGVIAPIGSQPRGSWYSSVLKNLASEYNFSFTTPWSKLPKKVQDILLYGTGNEEIEIDYSSDRWSGKYIGKWEGVINNLERRYKQTASDEMRHWIGKYMSVHPCKKCGGARLKKEALSVKISGKNISQITKKTIQDVSLFILSLDLNEHQREIAKNILSEIDNRLNFLVNVGLNYLTLDRRAETLSGGEAQRIRLASQVGSKLTGVLYVLDEPTIGLHQKDNKLLIKTLLEMRDLGNTVLVVEHDEDTILSSDYIVDIGPKAGLHGGKVVIANYVDKALVSGSNSLTVQYIVGEKKVSSPIKKRKIDGNSIKIIDASENNLKNISVKIPLKTFTVVTGVSGSGKSTLIDDVLAKALKKHFYDSPVIPGKHNRIEGVDKLDKLVMVDQSPIGRTPRSNPATYTGIFTPTRDLFSNLPESKKRAYKPGRFSFNVSTLNGGGRCESCQGDGYKRIEMHFLPDVYITCEVCKGKRFSSETLEVKYRGKSISDILEMTVEEATMFFENIPTIGEKLKVLEEVGLGYIKLGQSAPTLSGGEAQRIKLATELMKKATGQTLYIFDEPTVGLHFSDIQKLVDVLHKLIDKGNTIVVIEHNLDIIKQADWMIDLGPEGGDRGGNIVAQGPISEIIKQEKSYTGQWLKKHIKN